MKAITKSHLFILVLLTLFSCRDKKKDVGLAGMDRTLPAKAQEMKRDTLVVGKADLIFLRASEKEFDRLLEAHGEESGLYEVDSDFGFYASNVKDSLSRADFKIEFATERVIKMDSENGPVFIDRSEIANGAYGIIFNHTDCYPTVEFGVMTDVEIYQRMNDRREQCKN